MRKLYIFGTGENGKKAYRLLMSSYEWKEKYQFVGFCDSYREGLFMDHCIQKPNQILSDSVVILAITDEKTMIAMYDTVYEHGVRDIFWFKKDDALESRDLFEQCVNCREWGGDVVRHIEINLADHCNLNCKCCSHFSALFSPRFPTIEQIESDLKAVRGKFTHILNLYLMGGEPLLNKDLGIIIIKVRALFPDTRIVIVTNGILLPQLDEDVLETIRGNNIHMDISEYKPTMLLTHRIKKILNSYNISYTIKEMKSDDFYKLLSVSSDSKFPKGCLADGCYDVWNGRIARCPMLMYMGTFNRYFGTDFPEDGVYDLNSDISGEELKLRLKERVPLCAHCITKRVSWEQCDKHIELWDFAERE